MSQPEGQCHTGTSQVSQMIWMEKRIQDLEDQLAAVEASNKNLKSCYVKTMRSLDRKTVDCIEARQIAEALQGKLQWLTSQGYSCPGITLPWKVQK